MNNNSFRADVEMIKCVLYLGLLPIVLFILRFIPYSLTIQQQEKQKILKIFVSEWEYGDLGCHGSQLTPTPYIDSLVLEGLRLWLDFFGDTCAPSQLGLMTGKYKHNLS